MPAGTIAPVAICTQVPSSVSGAATDPASSWPTIRHGARPRTAQPSMLEVGNAGRSVERDQWRGQGQPVGLGQRHFDGGSDGRRAGLVGSLAGDVPRQGRHR